MTNAFQADAFLFVDYLVSRSGKGRAIGGRPFKEH